MRKTTLAAIAIAAGTALVPSGAVALEAHEELEAALQTGTQAEFEAQGVIVRAQMPCDEPEAGPPGPDGLQSSVCTIGSTMFVLVASSSVPPTHPSSLTSDFDAAYAIAEEAPQTAKLEKNVESGRNTFQAERGGDAPFGLMRAIQFAPDGLAYAISLAAPGASATSEADEQMMRNFAASLEIVE